MAQFLYLYTLMENIYFQFLIYISFFIIALGFSVLVNLLLLNFSKTYGIKDNQLPEQVRWQSGSKPTLGGISFFIVFLLSVSSYFILPYHSDSFFGRELFAMLGACTLGFLIGLYDDTYHMKPSFKFLGQIACGLFIVSMGIFIPLTPYNFVNYIFTIIWVVGIMNSINMLDNMDGVTGSVSLAIVGAAIMLLVMFNQVTSLYMIISVGMAAALIGFLFFNWHPSKMYMGDNGSQFLGVFLAYISIVLMWKFRDASSGVIAIKQFLVPLIIFIVPIIDTLTVFVRRILRGQSPFLGGRDHTTHHLAFNGFGDKTVAFIFFMLSIISVVGVYFLIPLFADWNLAKSLLVIAYFVVVFTVIQLFYERGKSRIENK